MLKLCGIPVANEASRFRRKVDMGRHHILAINDDTPEHDQDQQGAVVLSQGLEAVVINIRRPGEVATIWAVSSCSWEEPPSRCIGTMSDKRVSQRRLS